MTPTALIVWAIGLAVAFAVGWAHGRAGAIRETLPEHSGDCREECMKIAKAHDFAQIDRQLTRMEARP